jgi:hypothetical protein
MYKKDCFIICPLDKDGSAIRKRSDTILKHVLSPVLESKNYTPIRADKVPKAGLITSQIINLIIDSSLVIADLSGGNPNVFYELAIRHATKKPYIQIIEEGNKIPFDVGVVRTISVNHSDLDSVEKAKIEIFKQIEEFENGHTPDSPISIATQTKLIQENEDLAESIAEKINSWGSLDLCGYDLPERDVQEITDILNRFTTHGIYKIEDLDNKLNRILEQLKKIS